MIVAPCSATYVVHRCPCPCPCRRRRCCPPPPRCRCLRIRTSAWWKVIIFWCLRNLCKLKNYPYLYIEVISILSARCLPWPVDTTCWRLLSVPPWEAFLGGGKGGVWKSAWLDGWDRDGGAKWCNSQGSLESGLRGCMAGTRWHSNGRGISFGIRRDTELYQLGKRTAQELQRQKSPWRGRLYTLQHKGESQRQAMGSSQKMEWRILRWT